MTTFSAATLSKIVNVSSSEYNLYSPNISSGDLVAVSYRCSNLDFLSIGCSGGGVGSGDVERDSTFDGGVDDDWHWRRFIERCLRWRLWQA
jgi:hypothetical protein